MEGAERADEDHATGGVEAQRPRRAAARRGAELAVLEEAERDRGVDALADDTPSQAGDPPDLGPGGGLTGPHDVHDAEEARELVRLGAEPQRGLMSHA